MRSLALLFAVVTPLAACSETVPRPDPPPVNWQSFQRAAADAGPGAPTAKESAIAQAYATALGSSGFTALASLVNDDAHFSFPGPGLDDVQGRDAVVHAHDVLFGAFDQRRFVMSRLFRTADEQTAEWTMSGVQARDWMGVAASQKPVTIRGVSLLWTKDDGTLSDFHVYFDVAAVKALLGSGPKELAALPAPAMPTGATAVVDQTGQEPDNVAVVRTALDGLENTNEAAYLGTMADDVEIHTLERVEPARGKEERRAYFHAMHKAMAQLDTTIENGWSVGPFAIVEYSITGEQLGPIGWVPQQRDQVVKLHVVDVDEIRNGKIAAIWRYDNPNEMTAPGP
jgi:SnoaL-like polyketide cyclase